MQLIGKQPIPELRPSPSASLPLTAVLVPVPPARHGSILLPPTRRTAEGRSRGGKGQPAPRPDDSSHTDARGARRKPPASNRPPSPPLPERKQRGGRAAKTRVCFLSALRTFRPGGWSFRWALVVVTREELWGERTGCEWSFSGAGRG